MPKISVVVPIYNVEQHLERCVNSLLKQSLKDIEIILVEDGSPDGCAQICDRYEKEYSNIVVIHKENEGLGMARNSGIAVAKGEYIAFVDSDDYVESNMYEEMYEQANAHKANVVISGGFISEEDCGPARVVRETTSNQIFEGEQIQELLLKMTGSEPTCKKDYEYEMSACKAIYRREDILGNNVRFMSERQMISEDLLFHYDLLQYVEKILVIPECYYHYCMNRKSLTNTHNPNRFKRNVEFYEYMLELLEKRQFLNGKMYADRLLLARARVCITQIICYYRCLNSKARAEVRDICNHEVLRTVVKAYPVCKLPIKQRMFVCAMQYKMIGMLWCLVKLNLLMKKHGR